MTDGRAGTPGASAWRLRAAIFARSLAYAAPDFPGRGSLVVALKRYARRFDTSIRTRFGGGLVLEGNPARDANLLGPALMRHRPPPLAPVLDAALGPGGVFADVGANIGLYTLWAARRVGPQGEVHAFEPAPDTRSRLERNVAINRFPQVRIVPEGVGAAPGVVALHVVPGVSGVTSRYAHPEAEAVEVPVTTLDRYFSGHRPPRLVKVDVEGMELEVFRGAEGLLGGDAAPVLVFEADPRHFAAAGTIYAEIRSVLEGHGYTLWALRGGRIRPEARDAREPGSEDLVALRTDRPDHERVRERLVRQARGRGRPRRSAERRPMETPT